MTSLPDAPSPAARKAAKRGADGEPRPPSTPAQLREAPPPAKPAKIDITYTLRPSDKYLNLKFHYPNDLHRFVTKADCEEMLNVFTAMQRESQVCMDSCTKRARVFRNHMLEADRLSIRTSASTRGLLLPWAGLTKRGHALVLSAATTRCARLLSCQR